MRHGSFIAKRLHAAAAALVATAGALGTWAAEPVTVHVTSDDGADGSVRLLLTHSEPVSYSVQAADGRIRILYSSPVAVDPPGMTLGGRVLDRYRQRDDRTLVVDTGPDYTRYESFELENPFRVVLDLQVTPGSDRPVVERERGNRKKEEGIVIVLDPGHGGMEDGAIGPTGLEEKVVTLDLARRLKRELRSRDPRVSVVLTRDEDRILGLDERAAIANHNQADLFVSLHLNGSPSPRATGTETYYLATEATDLEAKLLAARENAAAGLPPIVVGEAEPRSLDLILWDLAQTSHLAQSSALAQAIQRHLDALTGARNRGVRQAPFRVLMGATMPAVLVEAGFISNEQEEAKLRTPEYRDRIVEAMATAIGGFLRDLHTLTAPEPLPTAVLPAPLRRGSFLVLIVAFGLAGFAVVRLTGDRPTAPPAERAVPSAGSREPSAAVEVPPPTAEAPGLRTVEITVYYPALDGEGLVGEAREIFDTATPGDRAKQILADLISGPASDNAVRAVPQGTIVRQVFVVENGVAYLDFSGDLRDGLGGGSLRELLAVYAIVDSVALNVPEIRRVGILIDGEPIESLTGHVDLRRPIPPDRSWIVDGSPDEDADEEDPGGGALVRLEDERP